ncbi:signal peptidase I [Coralloluteibacterium stylophorae]|uniref:Signal peptidase I n=1 Tax=Coralloluteibacterium stylophorae TaxID=1776034 RepID=A0A8J7VUY8_9GAMM|nr:signal peptidase I [Coralloluteibacterium stylophorae]MBS7458612.1 signal peptidase I [Coralloluteibacterium stylophorae]
MAWFENALVLLSVVTGVVWLLDALVLRRRRRARGGEAAEPAIVEYSRSLFPVIFAVLILRSFIAEPFRIPSNSMMPTLLTGDFILVNKFAYGLRLPVSKQKVVELGEPERGDVVVFRFPGNGPNDPTKGVDYIKRVVGLPGDTVSFAEDHTLSVNGKPVTTQPIGPYEGAGASRDMAGALVNRVTLGDHSHRSLQIYRYSDPRLVGTWTVPAGHYFAMGDNRDNSEDSRVWGFVPEENLVGKAFFIWLNCKGWFCSEGFDASRIGDTIR